MSAKADFEIPSPVDLGGPHLMNIDEAVEHIFKAKGWPLLGGPSGRGWSHISVAQRCPRLFQATYDVEGAQGGLPAWHPEPLQVGSLFHTLLALFYAGGFGEEGAIIAPDRGGLLNPRLATRGRRKTWAVPATAADELLEALKKMCGLDLMAGLQASVANGNGAPPSTDKGPHPNIVLAAERLFDAHANYWGSGKEDVEPLAIEWYAEHPQIGYTCRYDMIGQVGPNDPNCPPGVVIFERKSAAWINEQMLEGWMMDGEVLGQILCWKASGCEERFGKLSAVVVDITSKGKVTEHRRVIIPPTTPAVDAHGRWVQMTRANIALWRATGVYAQNFGNCFTRYGRCSQWTNCALGVRP